MGPLMTEKKEMDYLPGVQREGACLPLLIQEPQCASRPSPHWLHTRGRCICVIEGLELYASLPFHQAGRRIKSSFKTTT